MDRVPDRSARERLRTGLAEHRWSVLAGGLLVLPILGAVLTLPGGRPWYATDDWAIELAHTADVGGRHTPLVGVYSRFGWYHPGPLLYWVLAPFEHAFGPKGMLAGTGLVNAFALAGVVVFAHRRGGTQLAVLAAAVGAVLCRSLALGVHPGFVVDPWNPEIALLPFLLLLLLAWSVLCEDWPALPWMVGVASFIVQTHIGYAPLAIGLPAFATGWRGIAWWHRRRAQAVTDTPQPLPLRSLVVAGSIGVVLWLAPVIQQLSGHPGNLGALFHYFTHPAEHPLGVSRGLGVMGRELAFPGPWINGHDSPSPNYIVGGSILPGALLTTIVATLGVLAWRRGHRDAGRLAALAVADVGLGIFTVSRIVGTVYPYLVFWTWIIGAVLWLSIIWSAWCLLASVRIVDRAMSVAAPASLAVLTLANGHRFVPSTVPQSTYSRQVATLLRHVTPHLDPGRTYLVDTSKDVHVGAGLGLELQRRDYTVELEADLAFKFGSWRVATGSRPDAILMVVDENIVGMNWRPPPRSRLLASAGLLTLPELRLEKLLRSQASRAHGHHRPDARLAKLREKAQKVDVYLVTR